MASANSLYLFRPRFARQKQLFEVGGSRSRRAYLLRCPKNLQGRPPDALAQVLGREGSAEIAANSESSLP